MKKIIFISHDPLTDTIKKNYYLERFRGDGIEIEYWCVRRIVKYANIAVLNNEISEVYFKEVTHIDQLKKLLEERAKGAWICVELWFNWDTIPVFQLLKQYEEKLFSIDWYSNVPAISVRRKLLDDIKTLSFLKLYNAGVRVISRKVFNVYAKRLGIRPPAILFVAGDKQAGGDRRVISLNHHDFDIFQEGGLSENAVAGEQRYAVFLDIMLPYHPDFKRLKSDILSAEVYYRKLNKFFDKAEAKLGFPVIIAAHPKSSYKEEFNGRTVIKGKTNALVAQSTVVFTHHSVSMYYAILYRKQLALLTMNEFKFARAKSFVMQIIHYTMELYAQILHCSLINIDDQNELALREVDMESYERFEKTYIRGKSDKQNYDVIKDTLQLN
ncbi:hypothetical protein [Chitinophaga filiformis]|uniref:Uncharacterized protein n=1 Tax=Chitinophaga filiformis TaxID=104663 RepID=A0A1G7UCE0_CHIFI|nr:hypothetical protein [Chitinophaga filiformis]SDG45265.1 hypothetical protein SAMN04488121_104322 [Chitinophaga filiformis]